MAHLRDEMEARNMEYCAVLRIKGPDEFRIFESGNFLQKHIIKDAC